MLCYGVHHVMLWCTPCYVMVYPMLWVRNMRYRSPDIFSCARVLFVELTYHLVHTSVLLCSLTLSSNLMSHECVIVNKLEDYEWKNVYKRVH
jgi:hypothetical protein